MSTLHGNWEILIVCFRQYVYCEILTKILKSCATKLISAAYAEMMRNPEKYAWMTHIKDLLCSHGFWNIWRDQTVVNGKLFLSNFEQRLKDTHIQKSISDMSSLKLFCLSKIAALLYIYNAILYCPLC